MTRAPDNFQIRLLRVMNEKKVNTASMCRPLELDEASIWRILNRDATPSYKTLLKLADFFEVSLDYLCGRSDVREIQK